jgi:hypothetical protein
VSLEAEQFLSLAKEILSGSQKGKDQVKKMIDEIVNQLKQEDYEDASGEIPPQIDNTPQLPDVEELDMDTILDKINKSGMDSLTKAEKDFLYNL